MYLRQSDLFWGLNQNFIRALTSQAIKQTFQPGENVFCAEDPADFFYVLIQGRIRLKVGGSGRGVYIGDQTGEAFGWSALIGRDCYSATCVCEEPTVLLRFDKAHVCGLLEKDSESAAIFFKQLAGALGERLLQTYHALE